MCGLAALYAYAADAPPVSAVQLNAINQAMARRGPDGEGQWIASDQRIGLAHKRLAIIDLSDEAAQPMTLESPHGTLRISYNGEIYNFKELRHELELTGVSFRTSSDTEVLLQLYLRDGRDMVKRLRGMFAFALWDERKNGLLLARDPFGIKPLYYRDDGMSLAVASQVKALLAGLKAEGKPRPSFDAAGHAGFFLFGSIPEPYTLYHDIRALPAGSTLWVDGRGAGKPETFFDIAGILRQPSLSGDETDLGSLLRDSLAHHFVADVPVGVFLSSGLDSATLTALSSELKGASLDTLTLGFDEFIGTPNDEVPLAEAIAHQYGTRQHTVRVAGSDFTEDLDDLLAAMDQPSIDGVNTYFVAKAAKAAGLKVALSGLGGDELFSGYDTFSQVPALIKRLGFLPGIGVFGSLVRALTAPLGGHLMPPKAAGLLEYAGSYGDAYLLRRALFMPWEIAGVLGEDMARDGLRTLAIRDRLKETADGIDAPKAKIAALEMTWYMRNQLLRDADWAGMAHGLEIRVPLVDAPLLAALAPALAARRGPDKQAMAATPATRLPLSVRQRPKSGFFIPVREWMTGDKTGERGLRGWAKTVYQAQISS